MRLQKFLASAGISSRRAAEDLIRQGRVRVDGEVTSVLGVKVDPYVQVVCVDGVRVDAGRDDIYLVLNKPRGFITTARDPQARDTVMKLIEGVPGRVYPVGRLDRDSEGFLLFTNDGLLANRLIHPRYKLEKTYIVTVSGSPRREDLARLEQGIELDGRLTLPCRIRKERSGPSVCVLKVTLREGRKRQIREMFGRIGHRVVRLVRIGVGPLRLGKIPQGAWRMLTPDEVRRLKEAVGLG